MDLVTITPVVIGISDERTGTEWESSFKRYIYIYSRPRV